jgi:hypothetical protein
LPRRSNILPEAKISKQAKDIIQKYASSLFKDASLEFYGIKAARIKELINVELPVIEVAGSSTDIVFLLDDNTYLHFEFQTTYNKSDLMRFATYDIRLYERDGRRVITIIIYTADVREADTAVDIGSLTYVPGKVMMYDYDGNAVYRELNAKLETGKELTDTDMLNLIFLPLMRSTIPRSELAVKSIKMALTIPDTNKRNACIAAAYAFACRYLSENECNKLLEVLEMKDMLDILIERSLSNKEKNTLIAVAKKLLRRNIPIQYIAEDTGLDEPTINELQAELVNE